MTRNVWITVRGIQRDADGNESVTETVVSGEYYEKGGSCYFLYEETPEGESGTVKNVIKQKDTLLELTKKGVVNARMVFEQGRTHMTNYMTPYGALALGVKTDRVECLTGPDSFALRAEYELLSGEELISECQITIEAKAIDMN